jgi:hypothetical protein
VKLVERTELFDNGHVAVGIVLFATLLQPLGSKSLSSIVLAIAGYLGAIHLIAKGEESK